MKRQLWGELSEKPDEATIEKQIELDQEILMEKRGEDDRDSLKPILNLKAFSRRAQNPSFVGVL